MQTPPRSFSAASLFSAPAIARGLVARRLKIAFALALALLSLPERAAAHVAASVDDNNRYLKLSLLGDRVRLAYTVFFGEVPGRAMRPAIDANRNGQLEPAETDAFAARLRAEVAGQLRLAIDDAPVALRFSQHSFGSVTSSVRGGAFSVDLIATVCISPAPRHRLHLRDRFTVTRPGETEVYFEDAPGIAVVSATIGGTSASTASPASAVSTSRPMFRFAGAVPMLAEPGLALEFSATPDAPGMRGGSCATPGGPKERARWMSGALGWAIPAGFALVGLAGLVGFLAWRRRSIG